MNGILLIDKPPGITSFGVIARLRHALNERRIGHAGTLDPLATGLLIVGVGKGTKQLTSLVGLDKRYTAGVLLGVATDTFDTEGTVCRSRKSENPSLTDRHEIGPRLRGDDKEESVYGESVPSLEDISRALIHLVGTYEQSAPLFSAKKIGGKKLYDLARAGKATEDMRPKKRITVHSIDIVSYDYPHLVLDISCSSGTYIRTIADDLGRALDTGGCIESLRRTSVGDFSVEDAHTLESLTGTRISCHHPIGGTP
jgi:tRNA pseudouridine55 synthase